MVFGFFRRKERAPKLSELFMERIIEAEELLERLKAELHALKRRREELRQALREAELKGDYERAELLRGELEDLTEKIVNYERNIKVVEVNLKKLYSTTNIMTATVIMGKIAEAFNSNLNIMSDRLRPRAEAVLRNFERTMLMTKSTTLPTPESKALYETMVERKPKTLFEYDYEAYGTTKATQEPLRVEKPQVAIVDGAVKQVSVEELAQKVYEIIMIYIKYGKKDLLSVKRIAQHLKVSEQDVRKALEYLEKQGKVVLRRGRK